MSETENPVVVSGVKPVEKKKLESVVIRMWPKTPILYPMALVALVCGIITQIWGGDYREVKAVAGAGAAGTVLAQVGGDAGEADGGTGEEPEGAGKATEVEGGAEVKPVVKKGSLARTLGIIFLFSLFVSLFTLCVNLDIRWGLIFVSLIVIAILAAVIANFYVDFVANFFGFLHYFDPACNAQFYYGIFGVWVLLMGISYMVSRFNYVRIEANEVVVVGGMLESQQRFSTMRMRYRKEILDVLEFYLPLVRSGRLVLSFPEQSEAVILDNVINIEKATREIDELISSLKIVSD